VRLKWPYRRITAVANYDFNPSEGPEGANQLPLKKGCQVIVLSKEGDHKGWWKGKIKDKVCRISSVLNWLEEQTKEQNPRFLFNTETL
jgi:hypothetical protein